MSSKGFRKIVLAVSAVVAGLTLSLVDAGTAAASEAAASEKNCGTKYCIKVERTGLHVGWATVTLKGDKVATGYFFVQAIGGSSSNFVWKPKAKQYVAEFELKRNYEDGTVLCGGVAPTREEKDYVGLGCVTVHK